MSGSECKRCWIVYHRKRERGKQTFWLCDECYPAWINSGHRATQPGGIDSLDLTARSRNALCNLGVATIEELRLLNERQLRMIKNIGKKSISEILGAIMKVTEVENSVVDPEKEHYRAVLDLIAEETGGWPAAVARQALEGRDGATGESD